MHSNLKVTKDLVTFTMDVALLPGTPSFPADDHPLWSLAGRDLKLVGIQRGGARLSLTCKEVPGLIASAHRVAGESGKHKTEGEYISFRLTDADGGLIYEHHLDPGVTVAPGQKLRVEFGTAVLSGEPSTNAGVGVGATVAAVHAEVETE